MNIWQSYKQGRGCLMHFARLANTLLKDEESARDNHVFASIFAKYSTIQKKLTHTLSNKPFLIWLLITQTQLKVAPLWPRFLAHPVVCLQQTDS